MFKAEIISYHETRKDALNEELKLQIKNNVVKSKDFFNESLAIPNGYFGRNMSGLNNPSFGVPKKQEIKDKISKTLLNNTNAKGVRTDEAKKNIGRGKIGNSFRKGKIMSEDSLIKISKGTSIGMKNSVKWKAAVLNRKNKPGNRLGQKVSEESKEKNRQSQLKRYELRKNGK